MAELLEENHSQKSKDDSELSVKVVEGVGNKGDAIVAGDEDDPEYLVSLTTSRGNISDKAIYLSLLSDAHPESFEPGNELNPIRGSRARNYLENNNIINKSDESIKEEVPEKLIEYAQAASISEVVDEVDIYEIIGDEEDNPPQPYGKGEIFEDFINSVNIDDKKYWKSQEIVDYSDELKSVEFVGSYFSILRDKYRINQKRYEDTWKASESNPTTWNLEEIKQDLEVSI